MGRFWGILAITSALVLAGCTVQVDGHQDGAGTTPPTSDPVVAGGSIVLDPGSSSTCADGSTQGSFVFGLPLTNRSDAPVKLGDVDAKLDGVELLDTWAVGPEVGEDDSDASTSWTADNPPTDLDLVDWSTRTPVGDTTVSAHSTTWIAIVIGLTDDAAYGTATKITLAYTDAAGDGTTVSGGSYGIGRLVSGQISCAA